MDALKKYKHFFGVLAVAKPELRRALLLKADDALLRAIIEVVLNTVNRNISLPNSAVKNLRKYGSQLRQISQTYNKCNKKSRASLKTQRKRLLQNGGGFIPTIFGNILTALDKSNKVTASVSDDDGVCRNDPTK